MTSVCNLAEGQLSKRKIALVIIEGVGIRDFPRPYYPCQNSIRWFSYEPTEAQYLTITTGKRQVLAYPTGYKYYLETMKGRSIPFQGILPVFLSIPSGGP